MKLLIVTQVVDIDDPVLGFFHRWIGEFAQRYEHIEVICLRQGRYSLPGNVRVHSLGKEKGAPRVPPPATYSWRFLVLVWRLRREYDAVFVHMNEEYVLIAGTLWRLWNKDSVFWRNFKTGTWMTPIACRLASKVCYTSRDSFTARFKNSIQMPIGIDTTFFSPGETPPPPHSILFLGRLDPIKKAGSFVTALRLMREKGMVYKADIVGDPSDPASTYPEEIRALAAEMIQDELVTMHPGVSQIEARAYFRSHAVYCNLSPSGLFDKTIGEAICCGAIPVTVNKDMRAALPSELIAEADDPTIVAECLTSVLTMSNEKRLALVRQLRTWIEHDHSLSLLAARLATVYTD